MRIHVLAFAILLSAAILHSEPNGGFQFKGPIAFKATADCDTNPCLYGMQEAVDARRTRGPKVDMKATLTAFLASHPDTALLLVGEAQGRLGLWAYQGPKSAILTSEFSFTDFATFAKAALATDDTMVRLLLPEPIWAQVKGAKTLVIVPLDGFPKIRFADMKLTAWDKPLGQKLKVTVMRKIEALNEL